MPKSAGGLGVKNLRIHNMSLITKILFKFINQADIPWVQLIWQAHHNDDKLPQSKNPCGLFWWKDCLTLWDKFMSLTNIKAGTGRTVRFWQDKLMDPQNHGGISTPILFL